MNSADEYGGEEYRPSDMTGSDASEIGWLERESSSDSVAPGSDPEADPEMLRADIAETRDRMSDTLGEIGERLNPHRVTEQVKDSIREATIGRVENMAQQAADKVNETKRGIVDTVRDNPLPAAMVALGLGWMILNGRGESNDKVSGYRQAAENLRGEHTRGYNRASGYAAGRGDMNASSDGIADTLREKAGTVRDTVTDSASGLADRAQTAAQNMAGTVAQNSRMGTRRVEDAFFDNPLLTGAITIALGLATGMVAPSTHPEVALMGGARDQLGDEVRDLVEDTKHKAEHVAGRVIDEAKSAAHDEGLVAEQ